jgi:hypothetical protein
MVWKVGESGNPSGRPTLSQDERDYRSAAKWRHEYLRRVREDGLGDPLFFLHQQAFNEALPLGLRCSLAQGILPFLYPKIGYIAPPKYIDHSFDVQRFQTEEDAEAHILDVVKLVTAGELGMEAANGLVSLTRQWIDSKRQGQELELKRAQAGDITGDQLIRIEGGLPELPGTSISMPHQLNGHVIASLPGAAIESTPVQAQGPEPLPQAKP